MGMYSNFEYEDIEITDEEGLNDYIYTSDNGYAERLKKNWTGGEIFSHFDGFKIISYWYDEFLDFLEEIAKFIEGEVYFTYENHEHDAFIYFADGEPMITIGTMAHADFKTDELRTELSRCE